MIVLQNQLRFAAAKIGQTQVEQVAIVRHILISVNQYYLSNPE